MKKRVLVLLFLVLVLARCMAQTERIKIYYVDSQGERIFLNEESLYDIEEKPTVYYIDNPDNKSIYIVEIYRIIDSKEHFYQSFTLSYSDVGNGFDIKGVFADVTSPFVAPSGYTMNICRTDKQHYLKLKSREQWGLSVEYKILKEE